MAEVQQCSQQIVNQKLKNEVEVSPHHITVSGNRNLIPVQRPQPPENGPQPPEPPLQPVAQTPVPAPAAASLATLQDILQQRNPKREVKVTLNKSALKIGQDSLDLSVQSNHDGYVYLVMLGSDAKSFYILFSNGLDGDNRIRAKQTLRLPRVDWQVVAAGPAGTDHLLVMVSDAPRQLDGLTLAKPSADVPFTYTLNTLGGRTALIDFLTGSTAAGQCCSSCGRCSARSAGRSPPARRS